MKEQPGEAPKDPRKDQQHAAPPQGERPQNPFRDEVPAARELADEETSEREQQRKEALTERD